MESGVISDNEDDKGGNDDDDDHGNSDDGDIKHNNRWVFEDFPRLWGPPSKSDTNPNTKQPVSSTKIGYKSPVMSFVRF